LGEGRRRENYPINSPTDTSIKQLNTKWESIPPGKKKPVWVSFRSSGKKAGGTISKHAIGGGEKKKNWKDTLGEIPPRGFEATKDTKQDRLMEEGAGTIRGAGDVGDFKGIYHKKRDISQNKWERASLRKEYRKKGPNTLKNSPYLKPGRMEVRQGKGRLVTEKGGREKQGGQEKKNEKNL